MWLAGMHLGAADDFDRDTAGGRELLNRRSVGMETMPEWPPRVSRGRPPLYLPHDVAADMRIPRVNSNDAKHVTHHEYPSADR